MPIYEYKCTACDDRFEIEQRITDDALTTLQGCPVADNKAHRLKKVFSSIGISFKGDGFYRNDARGGAKSKSRASESGDSTSSTPAGTPSSGSDSSGSDSSGSDSSSSDSSTSSGGSSSSGSGDKSPTPAKTASASSSD